MRGPPSMSRASSARRNGRVAALAIQLTRRIEQGGDVLRPIEARPVRRRRRQAAASSARDVPLDVLVVDGLFQHGGEHCQELVDARR